MGSETADRFFWEHLSTYLTEKMVSLESTLELEESISEGELKTMLAFFLMVGLLSVRVSSPEFAHLLDNGLTNRMFRIFCLLLKNYCRSRKEQEAGRSVPRQITLTQAILYQQRVMELLRRVGVELGSQFSQPDSYPISAAHFDAVLQLQPKSHSALRLELSMNWLNRQVVQPINLRRESNFKRRALLFALSPKTLPNANLIKITRKQVRDQLERILAGNEKYLQLVRTAAPVSLI